MSDGPRHANDEKMDVDRRSPELKIRGQAEAEKRKGKWDEQDKDEPMGDADELARRESELKEKALRNKVVRTRKASSSAPQSESK